MAREVITQRDIDNLVQSGIVQKSEPDSSRVVKDGYTDRLFKYIPAEVVAGYIFVLGLLKQLTDLKTLTFLDWLLFLIFCVLTPLYLWKVQKVTKTQQHVISLLSFIVWVFAIGGPFSLYAWYNPVYGEILLPVFTLIVAIWEAD
jgi:hypothetical protein